MGKNNEDTGTRWFKEMVKNTTEGKETKGWQEFRNKELLEKFLKGGLNATEIESLKVLTTDDYLKINKKHGRLAKTRGTSNNTLMAIIALIGIGLLFFTNWLSVVGGLMLFYAICQTGINYGHKEGYRDGYLEGFDNGINKLLGISDEQSEEIHDFAIEMQRDREINN